MNLKKIFSIIVKPSVVNLDCFTSDAYVFEYAPIKKSNAFYPKWIKDMPKDGSLDYEKLLYKTSIKSCDGVLNQYKNGIILPLWSELLIEVGALGSDYCRWRFSDNTSQITIHTNDQRGNYLPDESYQHIKLHSPWFLKCNRDINWQCLPTIYNNDKPENFIILPGILDFKYQHANNVQMMIPREEKNKIVNLKHGTPLCQFMPLTEKKINVHNHLISIEEFRHLHSKHNDITFTHRYKNVKRIKCPFHK